jgi:glutathione synthase/RimK-type ligase-like ATP-grasp enzyme
MLIDGELYPLHVAISKEWKIHFLTAEMADNPDNRAEDAAFLNNMPEVLGERAMAALQQIAAMLGLDYAGVDFSLDQEGQVILYEANATMVVNPPDRDPKWDYRRAAVQRIQDAIRRLLTGASARRD